jgi:hypothetical protein
MFAGFVVVQQTKTSPLEHFNWLGYVMVGFITICLFLVYRMSQLVKQVGGPKRLRNTVTFCVGPYTE